MPRRRPEPANRTFGTLTLVVGFGILRGAGEAGSLPPTPERIATMLDTDLSPKVVGKISYQFDITDTMINDILITAIEGGINQWCTEVGSVGDDLSLTPGSHLGHGGKLQFTLVEQ